MKPDAQFCAKTRKTRYESRDRARKALHGLRAKLRVYFCESCKGWHLTKSTKPYEKGQQ